MEIEIASWLSDIKQAINEINEFLPDRKEFLAFQKDTKTKRAIERNIEIIGEAVNRIVTRDSSFVDRISNAKSIIGLRNQVIHAYDSISDENIWSILTNHLPKLKTEVDTLVNL